MDLWEAYPKLLDPAYVEAYDFSDSWTRKNPGGPYEDLDVAVALVRTTGNVSAAARLLGRSRRSLHGFVLRNIHMKDLLEDIEQEFLDYCEQMCRDDAMAEDGEQSRWKFLTTKGKERGYTLRQEQTGANNGPIQIEDVHRDAADFARQMARLAAGDNEGETVPTIPGGASGPSVDLEGVVGASGPASTGRGLVGHVDGPIGTGLREDSERDGVDSREVESRC